MSPGRKPLQLTTVIRSARSCFLFRSPPLGVPQNVQQRAALTMDNVLGSPVTNTIDAIKDASPVLTRIGVNHVVIGGSALQLLGHQRATEDIDILIDCPGSMARELLINNDPRFELRGHKLVFNPEGCDGKPILVEFLQSGLGAALQMPDILPADTIHINSVPLLHPAVLLNLKLRRWYQYAGSTRPRSVHKAEKDSQDIAFLVRWLAARSERIKFWKEGEEHKSLVLQAFKSFHEENPNLQASIQTVLALQDQAAVLGSSFEN